MSSKVVLKKEHGVIIRHGGANRFRRGRQQGRTIVFSMGTERHPPLDRLQTVLTPRPSSA